jgi:hypothetical protein
LATDLRKTKIKDITKFPENEEEIQGIIDATIEKLPTPSNARLLIVDDSGEAELVHNAYWKPQMDYLKRYGTIWKRMEHLKHLESAPLNVGDKVRIVGATSGFNEEGQPTLILQSYSSIINYHQE